MTSVDVMKLINDLGLPVEHDETLRDALAEAWIEGRDDGLDDSGATQTAIDYGEVVNPYGPGDQ